MAQSLTVRQIIEVNLNDHIFADLARAAGRISALLSVPKVSSDRAGVGCLDELVGAVYALIFARLGGFVDRPQGVPIQPKRITERTDDISAGKIRTDGTWMAGFHFNGALFRIAAVYHRSLKVVLAQPASREYAPALLPKVAVFYQRWTSQSWQSKSNQSVYDEVNSLKHTPEGVYRGRAVNFSAAVAAIEEILILLENWAAQP